MGRIVKIVGALVVCLVLVVGVYIVVNQVPDRSVEELKGRWAQAPSTFIDVNGMQIHVRDEGPRDDISPIVLLHGTSASLHTWDGWTNTLIDERRVIRFDMPAFGLTGPSPQSRYTIEDYASTVIAVLDELGVKRAVLGGNSLGGYVAWATAVLHPARVEQLVLVDAAGYPYQAQSVPLGFKIASTPALKIIIGDLLPRSLIESSVKNVYGDPSRVTPELVDRYFDLTTRAGNRKALVERFRQTQPSALAQQIPTITVPTLILWGAKDRLIPPTMGERFHREIKGSELVVFEALGHVPHEEDAQKTVAAVQAFLASSAGSTR